MYSKLKCKYLLQKKELEEIVECLCNGRNGGDAYSAAVRSFCMSIHYYSPRTYEYLRNKFNKHLPHKSTLQAWLNNSNIDASSGICKNSLDVVHERAKKMKEKGKQLICDLAFDECSIRNNIQYCQKTRSFIGYTTYGTYDKGPTDQNDLNNSGASDVSADDEFFKDCAEETYEDSTVANQAITFMLCGINDNFQIPIANYFVRTLAADDRAQLLNSIIEEVSKYDINIVSITFDGFASNAKMCELLGASFKNDLKPTIPNPSTGSEINIILDPSHVEKSVRNILESYGTIYDAENNPIKWDYFVSLVKYSEKHTFGLTHKITKRHIEFKNRKMHVRTAVELLSNSVADSMEFLMKNGVRQFKGAEATIKFIRTFDKLFDIMNTTRILNGNIYKSALNPTNKAEIFAFLLEAKKYIETLEIIGKRNSKRQKVVESTAKTGFRGYLIDIISVMNMYEKYVEQEKIMPFLATYRLSQDHIEMLFGRIRSMNGHNDNPNAVQYQSAYRKLLFNCDIGISSSSNVAIIGCTSNVLTVSSRREKLYDDLCGDVVLPEQSPDNEIFDDDLNGLEELERNIYLTDNIHMAGITFVANAIENRILTCNNISCESCIEMLQTDERVDALSCVNTDGRRPGKSTVQLCKLTDTAIKIHANDSSKSTFKQKIYIYVLNNLNMSNVYVSGGENHDVEHKNYVIKHVIDEYTRIKCIYLAKLNTLNMRKNFLRNKFRKILHFTGQ